MRKRERQRERQEEREKEGKMMKTKTKAKSKRDNSREWRRLIGSPKLQIIFHKRATKYRSLLRKMTNKDKGSYESLPPCRARAREIKIETSKKQER